ncbi:hypothetical protein LCGC14_1358930 [marine sediment metagenome]|uniref:Uncharacterized protein n=1 Tax=marine sediment metagenome TaxID=412755 RepID=A0A0F9MP35_9ZZZZ
MTNDNEETRNYTEIEKELRRALADNTMLRTQIAQMRQTIADYERADAVVQAMAKNNDVLGSVESSTYQVQSEEVGVDDEFYEFIQEEIDSSKSRLERNLRSFRDGKRGYPSTTVHYIHGLEFALNIYRGVCKDKREQQAK